MDNYVVVRTISNLSYSGEICSETLLESNGIMLKPSQNSGIKIWFPKEEVAMLIYPDGTMVKGSEMALDLR